jgi:hypothetical protein
VLVTSALSSAAQPDPFPPAHTLLGSRPPGAPLFQAAAANLNPRTEAKEVAQVVLDFIKRFT